MIDYKVIDVHTHIYPETIAPKAIENIRKFYKVDFTEQNGTAEGLLECGKIAGIGKFIIHSIATSKHQVTSINNFIMKQTGLHKEFCGFATLHFDMTEEEIAYEIDRILKGGLRGIKLHPDFQKIDADDLFMDKIYRNCEGKLPILFHAGDNRFDYSAPERIAAVAKKYPNLQVVAAHCGGYNRWSEIDAYEGLDNVYFDTSSSLFKLSAILFKDIMNLYGHNKFMFGSDYPMFHPKQEIERIINLRLSDSITEDILYNNAKAILKI